MIDQSRPTHFSQHARIYDFPIAFLHPLGLDPPHLHRLGDGLHRVGVEPPAAVARAPHHEHRRLVEQPVEGAQERVVAREELIPPARGDVAREDHRVRPVLLVAPVDDIGEQVGARPVVDASSHLVHDEARRLDERGDDPRGVSPQDCLLEPVPELGRLDVVGLEPPHAALAAVGLREVRLPYAAGPDEGDVAVRVEVGQRRELAQRARVPALDPGEVEALEGLGLAPGQPAQPQQRLDGGEPPLLRKVGEGGCHGGHLPVAEVEVRGEGRELLRPDGDPEPRRGVARELVGARPRARHHSALPKSNLSKPGFVRCGAICSTTVPTGWVGSSSGCAGDVSHCPSHQLSAPVPTAWATSSRERSSLYMCTTRPSRFTLHSRRPYQYGTP